MAVTPTIGTASERLQRTCSLSDDVSRLRYLSGRTGSARGEALSRLGITRVRDLLLHVPHRYLDFSTVVPISHADVGVDATIVAVVDKVVLKRPRPRMQIVELHVLDDTGVLVATFFRQPWIADQVKRGDRVALSGKVTFDFGFKQMRAPFLEVVDQAGGAGDYARVLPVHPVSEGISVSWMRRIMSAALADVGDVADWLPARLVASHGLMTLGRALREVHFPATVASAEAARRRLAYDELLCLQLALVSRRGIELDGIEPTRHVVDGPHMGSLLSSLPFSLTDEQRAAADQMLADMASPHVMNRLLLGDVGTGKTAVAALGLAAVADTGTQAAVMAPTSVLARQYAEKLGPLMDGAGISWVLVTGSTPSDERAVSADAVSRGEVAVVFGTTAILSDDIEFRSLSLVVIDEQHRFGVDQRAALRRKGSGADLLAMTATPIPRTLALSFYGDVDCSRIRHRPHAEVGVKTRVITPENLDLAYGAIREAVEAGRQAYVICPLVDDTDDGSDLDDVPESVRTTSGMHSATSMVADLAEHALRGITSDVLTGRMSADDKDATMARFRSGETSVLVATTVVEVGVDVPNATVMLVYDADRFGLATLHQLRGRVGRGTASGQVFLESSAKRNTTARKRLSALEATTDGSELAELDLKLRREGEVLGYRQHGGLSLVISDLDGDRDLVEAAHADALAITDDDPRLAHPEHATMAIEVRDRFGAYFDELERA